MLSGGANRLDYVGGKARMHRWSGNYPGKVLSSERALSGECV